MFFDTITVTDIQTPIVVYSRKERTYNTTCRTTWGLSLCRSGQITYTMDGKQYVSDKTVAVLLPQGGRYSLHGDQTGFFPLINFTCQQLTCDTIRVFPLRNPEACLRLFDRIKALSISGENRLKMFSAFYQLLDSMEEPQAAQSSLLAPAIAYIEQNLPDPTLNNTALATHTGISEVYLRKLFLTHLGTTPKQYILDLRIQKARQLLTDTAYTVAAVAECCGFSGPYHFCRAFKDRTGLTPTQFAEQNRIYRI